MATISKLPSGSWRAQVRRKGNYVSETFLRRGDAELWARSVESRIDRGEAIHAGALAAKTFGDLIALHKADLAEVDKPLGRSKAASLDFLALRLGSLKPSELGRERLIAFGRQRAREGAGPVSIVMYFVMFEGYPISLDLVLLGVALFLLFVMSTQVAFIAHAVPELLADKRFQGMLKQQPATLAVFTLTLFFLSAMLMEVIPH